MNDWLNKFSGPLRKRQWVFFKGLGGVRFLLLEKKDPFKNPPFIHLQVQF